MTNYPRSGKHLMCYLLARGPILACGRLGGWCLWQEEEKRRWAGGQMNSDALFFGGLQKPDLQPASEGPVLMVWQFVVVSVQ